MLRWEPQVNFMLLKHGATKRYVRGIQDFDLVSDHVHPSWRTGLRSMTSWHTQEIRTTSDADTQLWSLLVSESSCLCVCVCGSVCTLTCLWQKRFETCRPPKTGLGWIEQNNNIDAGCVRGILLVWFAWEQQGDPMAAKHQWVHGNFTNQNQCDEVIFFHRSVSTKKSPSKIHNSTLHLTDCSLTLWSWHLQSWTRETTKKTL